MYDDDKHIYTSSIQPDIKFTSVTTFLKNLTPAFLTEYWSVRKAFEYSGYSIGKSDFKSFFLINKKMVVPGLSNIDDYQLSVTPSQIKEDWNKKAILGRGRGSHLHKYLEQLDNRDTTPVTQLYCNKECDKYLDDETIPTFKVLEQLAIQFKKETRDWLIPICMEFTVADYDWKIAGRFDRLYYNCNSGEYEIWDFKNDKQIDYSNKYQSFDLFDMDDCEFNKYSLQTSMYKAIIEKNTNIKLGTSYVVHFRFRDNEYNIIPCTDHTKLINEKLNQ